MPDVITAGMGFSKPKAVKTEPAPPPVTTAAADVSYSAMDQRRQQARRAGYAKTLLSTGLDTVPTTKKTLLG